MQLKSRAQYQIDAPKRRDKVVRFLNLIGVPTRYEVGATGFSKGCRIERGELFVDPDCRVSTILHEAAHLAITPRCFRSLMSGNLFAGQREMLRCLDESGLHPDHSFYRAVNQATDPEATAWAWAAGKSLGLPDHELIRDDEYDGEGAEIRICLQLRSYVGIHGLAHAGFCLIRDRGGMAGWPNMNFWTQDAAPPAEVEALL